MPRFCSPEWVTAFNEAVRDLDVAQVGAAGSLTASSGRFRLAQLVRGGPEGDLCLVLEVADGRVTLRREDAPGPESDVTVSLLYADAAALSRGELDAAQMVGTGRVKVRGDLSVLVAGQEVLGAAATRLSGLSAATTY